MDRLTDRPNTVNVNFSLLFGSGPTLDIFSGYSPFIPAVYRYSIDYLTAAALHRHPLPHAALSRPICHRASSTSHWYRTLSYLSHHHRFLQPYVSLALVCLYTCLVPPESKDDGRSSPKTSNPSYSNDSKTNPNPLVYLIRSVHILAR